MNLTPEQIARFWSHVDQSAGPDGCWLWTLRHDRDGYGRIQLNGRKDRAHRVSYRLVHGVITPGLIVCHRCDNPPCVNPAHLFLGTHADNTYDAMAKGRRRAGIGERQRQAKLNAPQVLLIRQRYAAGLNKHQLAAEFAVTSQNIHSIIRRITWKHI